MKKVTIAGCSLCIGIVLGSIGVFGMWKNKPVLCICTKQQGDPPKWSGKDCPRDLRDKLKNTYRDTCPSPE